MYISSDQQRNYRVYSSKKDSFVAADAIGNIASKILLAKAEYTGPIFLYEIVVNDGVKQYSVFQMLSNSHTALTISHWLQTWINLGNPIPKKFVCDGSKAFLLAAVSAFTEFLSVNHYLNSMYLGIKPNWQLTMDFAHFIHNFAIFLRGVCPGLKKFYLCCVGLLVLCTSKKDAEMYLESILLILLSKNCGVDEDGKATICQEKLDMINLKLTKINQEMSDTINEGSNFNYSFLFIMKIRC